VVTNTAIAIKADKAINFSIPENGAAHAHFPVRNAAPILTDHGAPPPELGKGRFNDAAAKLLGAFRAVDSGDFSGLLSETAQTPFDLCDRLLRLPDAFPPIASQGDGPSTRSLRSRPQLGPFSFRTLGI
jgi:hypothetical protein